MSQSGPPSAQSSMEKLSIPKPSDDDVSSSSERSKDNSSTKTSSSDLPAKPGEKKGVMKKFTEGLSLAMTPAVKIADLASPRGGMTTPRGTMMTPRGTNPAKRDIPMQSPRGKKDAGNELTEQQRERLQIKFGSEFPKMEKIALELFKKADANGDHVIDREEFSKVVGLIGKAPKLGTSNPSKEAAPFSLANLLFDAVDVNRQNVLHLDDWVHWICTLVGGTVEDKLQYGFRLADINQDRFITKDDLKTLMGVLFSVLVGLEVVVPEVNDFVERLWGRLSYSKPHVFPSVITTSASGVFDVKHPPSNSGQLGSSAPPRSVSPAAHGRASSGDVKPPAPPAAAAAASPAAAPASTQVSRVAWEDFRRNCITNEAFIRSLGRLDNDADITKLSMKRGKAVLFGNDKWDFMVTLMLGLQLSVDRSPTVKPDMNDPKVYTEKKIIRVPSNEKTKMTIDVYAPLAFESIRQHAGISNESYNMSMSLQQLMGSLLLGDLSGLTELVSEGKSGSFFYYSADAKYLVKTIGNSEKDTLFKMAKDYHDHITKNKNTLLSKIYGLYKLNIEEGMQTTKIPFVVMGNIFNTDKKIHQRFDLKGSTKGRTCGEDLQNAKEGTIFRDLDFLELDRRINVGPQLAPLLRNQIRADIALLQRNSIIDYSLLIGIHKNPDDVVIKRTQWIAANQHQLQRMFRKLNAAADGNFFQNLTFEQFCVHAHKMSLHDGTKPIQAPKGASLQSAFTAYHGGIPSFRVADDGTEVIGEEILYLGVIDIFITYELRKQSEHILKSTIMDGNAISIVPPQEYGPRFVKFVTAAIE